MVDEMKKSAEARLPGDERQDAPERRGGLLRARAAHPHLPAQGAAAAQHAHRQAQEEALRRLLLAALSAISVPFVLSSHRYFILFLFEYV